MDHQLLDQIAKTMQPDQIRRTAHSLLHLADCLNDHSSIQEPERSVFRWPSALARIEREQAKLAWVARLIYDGRMKRRKFLPNSIFGEPGWDMLLDLFMQDVGGKRVATQSLCIASQVPLSTALRHISTLEAEGLVSRHTSKADKRVTFIQLTDAGKLAVGTYLLNHSDYKNSIFSS